MQMNLLFALTVICGYTLDLLLICFGEWNVCLHFESRLPIDTWFTELFHQPLPGLPRVPPGYSMGLA